MADASPFPLWSTFRWRRWLLWCVVLAAVVAISIPAARWVASEDEWVAADHFIDVVRDLAPGTRTIDLSCEEGSHEPYVSLNLSRPVIRRRLRANGWHTDGAVAYHRRFDGWRADVLFTQDPGDLQEVVVTQDYDLVCGDIIDRLRDGGFRVRGP